MSKSKDKILLIEDKHKKGALDFIKNKYAVGSAILLIIIITLVVIALRPPKTEADAEKEVNEGDIIYIIDEQGNKVIASATDNDSIVMQNQKEEEDPTVLAYNASTREGYMNNCVFLGDSRTVAMVSYGYISDANALAKVGISHWQVMSTTFIQNSGNKYTLTDYLRAHSEPVIYVCYGVNGMNGMDEDKYKQTYIELVNKIISLAGDRKIVLMSIWPVDDNGRYKGSVKNEWVNKYNTFLFDLAKEKGLYYLNIAPMLTDENGSMKKEYDSGDGLHYKSSAYKDILEFIIHHPVPGISDEGDFVVHYVAPKGEYKDIMTETPTLPQNTQVEADDYTFEIPAFPAAGTETVSPTPTPIPAPIEQPAEPPAQEEEKQEERWEEEQQQQEEQQQWQQQQQQQAEYEEQIRQYQEEQLSQQQQWQQGW